MYDEEKRVYTDKGQEIRLSKMQDKIMRLLLANNLVTYNQFIKELYDYDEEYEDLRIYVNRLMGQLNRKLNGILVIKNKFGIGYYI